MGANSYQVGGDHYQSRYQHWDLVANTGMGYFEGQATRYIARWRKKAGGQDLKKAIHYIDKLLELSSRLVVSRPDVRYGSYWIKEELDRFFAANPYIGGEEADAIRFLVGWRGLEDIRRARVLVQELLRDYEVAQAAKLADPKPVPLSEENHYSERDTGDEWQR